MDNEKYQKLVNRRRIKIAEQIEKRKLKQEHDRNSTLNAAVARVKEVARQDTWCTTHGRCFRASFGGNAESPAHRNKKYELWCEYMEVGCEVFTELRLKDEYHGRPDLIVCWHNGDVLAIEIVCSEKEKSLIEKENKYPFPIKFHFL